MGSEMCIRDRPTAEGGAGTAGGAPLPPPPAGAPLDGSSLAPPSDGESTALLLALRAQLTPVMRWALRHYDELSSPFETGEAGAMHAHVLAGLRALDAAAERDEWAWVVQPVGGKRRGEDTRAHDADLLVTAPQLTLGAASAVLHALVEWLCARELIVGKEPNEHGEKAMFMCSSRGAAAGSSTQPRGAHARMSAPLSEFGARGDARVDARLYHAHVSHMADAGRVVSGNRDTHARFFGVFRSRLPDGSAGPHRRIDIVVTSWLEFPFALLGWTGSRILNRWLRKHAAEHGFLLTSHFLYRTSRAQPPIGWTGPPWAPGVVPYDKREGIGGVTVPGDAVRSERDIYALLGLAYVPPHARDA